MGREGDVFALAFLVEAGYFKVSVLELSHEPSSGSMEREKLFIRVVVGAGSVVLALHLIFAYRWPAWGWGVHHLAFFPPWVRIGLPALGLILILPPLAGAASRLMSRLTLPHIRSTFQYVLYGLGAVAALAPFWVFRVRVHLLGDGALWIRELTGPLGRLENEPLTIVLVRLLYRVMGGSGEVDAERAYQVLSWMCGALFVFMALLAARALGRCLRERAITALFILSLGTLQLFFGYAEHYAPVTVVGLLYLCLGLHCLEGRLPLAAAAAALGLACAFHFAALVMVPSLGFLVLGTWRASERRVGTILQAAVFPLATVGMLLAIGFDFPGLARLGAESHTVPLWGGEPFLRPHALFSAVHIADVINAHLLSAPMGLLLCLCVGAIVPQGIDRSDAFLGFLGTAAICCLVFAAVFNPEIGAFRDWDLFSISSVPFALLGAYLLTRGVGPEAQRAVAWTVTVVALCHLAPWVGVNASQDRALARFEGILAAGERLSVHALGSSYDELRGYYERQGDPSRALGVAQEAFDASPKHARYLANLVRLLRETGQSERVEKVLLEIVEATPDFARAHLTLAQLYRQEGRLERASAACREALALDAKSGAAHAEMGTILHGQGREREAAAALERAVALEPNDAWTRSLIGVVYGKVGRIQESILAFRRALALEPNDVDTWANLGVAYYQTGRLEKAEEAFQKALALEPDSPTAKSGMGIFYQKRGKIETALRLFREALEVEPNNVQTLLNLASVAYETGNLEESLSACKRALEIDPVNRAAMHNLCALYGQMGRMEEAAQCARRFAELFPDSPQARGSRRW